MYLASNLGIRFWESFNMYEGVLWLNELLQKPQARSYPRACARALCIQAYLQFHFQQFDLEYEAAGEALELSRAVGDPQSECDSLNQLGSVLLVLDGMVQKVRFQEQALALARSIGDVWRQAEALSGLGWDKRDTKKSLAYREASIVLYRQMGDWYGLAFQLSLLAHDAALDGDIEYAQKILNEHSMLRQYTNDKRDAEFVLTAKARIALQQGDYETARFHLQKNISNLQELGNRMGYLWARARLGYVSLREGDFQAAHNILVECIQEFQKDRNQMGLIFPLELMATLLIHEDKPEHAARLIGWTEATRISTGNPISELDASDRRNNLDTLLSTLGENTFKVIYAEGSTMTLEQIVSYALEGYDHLPSL
jgi:tetratricopeptide (TPR) repeat protein